MLLSDAWRGFDDSVTPATATWEDVLFPLTSVLTLDPILFTDPGTGRTFVAQLAGPASLMAFTDDDGDSWLPSTSGLVSGMDHQSVGGGPLASLPGVGYPNAVYYCSQTVAFAGCALSLNGGLTFNPAVPIYNLLQCGGLHGHVKVAPDGHRLCPQQGLRHPAGGLGLGQRRPDLDGAPGDGQHGGRKRSLRGDRLGRHRLLRIRRI